MADAHSEVLRQLSVDWGGELVGINEFARLVGFDPSTAAQLRAERTHSGSGFPPAVAESGRSLLHRLEELIGWLEQSRFHDAVEVRPAEVAFWRLERQMRGVVEQIGVVGARRLLAGLAVRDSPGASVDSNAQRLIVQALLDDVSPEVEACAEAITGELARAGVSPLVADRVIVELGDHHPAVPNRTPSAFARLIAFILDAGPGHSVFEPTSGECEILLNVAELAALRGHTLGDVYASDDDNDALLIGWARLHLAGVTATVDQVPAPQTIDRLVLDPGWTTQRPSLGRWLRMLHADSRVVLVTRLSHVDTDLIAELPPTAVIIPPQRRSGTQGTLVIWVSQPLAPDWTGCVIADLGARSDSESPPMGERLRLLADALELRGVVPAQSGDAGAWEAELVDVIPSSVQLVESSPDELPEQLEAAISGTIGFSIDVVKQNERYALELSRELSRLIGGRSTAEHVPDLTRPSASPDGVLASRTTDEARRVLSRLSDALAGVRQWSRRTTK